MYVEFRITLNYCCEPVVSCGEKHEWYSFFDERYYITACCIQGAGEIILLSFGTQVLGMMRYTCIVLYRCKLKIRYLYS